MLERSILHSAIQRGKFTHYQPSTLAQLKLMIWIPALFRVWKRRGRKMSHKLKFCGLMLSLETGFFLGLGQRWWLRDVGLTWALTWTLLARMRFFG